MDKETGRLLDTREAAHGDFSQNAETAQGIKLAIAAARMRREPLPPVLQEVVDMIATKLGRIAAGDAFEMDHWKDIQGYAALAERHLYRVREATSAGEQIWPAETIRAR